LVKPVSVALEAVGGRPLIVCATVPVPASFACTVKEVMVPLPVQVTGIEFAAVEENAAGERMVGKTGGAVVAATPVPAEFTAATVNEYEVPDASPVISIESASPASMVVGVPEGRGVYVTMYLVIANPPSLAGALQVRCSLVLDRGVALKFCGGLGGPSGMPTAPSEAGPVPATVVAVTVQV
jgi:hypothetical protein